MDKLLIVDDDYLVCEGLRTTVDWASVGVCVAGTAKNGYEGLKKARELKPDLIIADVRMPIMDGIQMAKKLFDEDADLSVIVYSGYKDFESARRAVNCGVAGFLLKPIEEKELLKCVEEVLLKLHDRRKENKMLDQFVTNIPLVRSRQFERLLSDGGEEEVAAEQLGMLGIELPAEGTVVCIKCTDEMGGGRLSPFLKRAEEALSQYSCVSEELPLKAVIITSAAAEQVVEKLNELLKENLKSGGPGYTVAASPFNGSVGAAYKEAEQLCENSVFSSANSVITEAGNASVKKVVRDAIAIIERDYAKKISVRAVAFELYTSESHLMHEFKGQLGKTFNEVLTEYRMKKACELLIKGDMRVSEVAYAVGYNDAKYFSQVFKDYFNCMPSEFLERHK